nr:hypothetical protein [Klebsiella michiganensis]
MAIRSNNNSHSATRVHRLWEARTSSLRRYWHLSVQSGYRALP